MPDIIDIAQEKIEQDLHKALKKLVKTPASFSGVCLACGETVHQRRFCNADCREFYEMQKRPRLVIQGLVPVL